MEQVHDCTEERGASRRGGGRSRMHALRGRSKNSRTLARVSQAPLEMDGVIIRNEAAVNVGLWAYGGAWGQRLREARTPSVCTDSEWGDVNEIGAVELRRALTTAVAARQLEWATVLVKIHQKKFGPLTPCVTMPAPQWFGEGAEGTGTWAEGWCALVDIAVSDVRVPLHNQWHLGNERTVDELRFVDEFTEVATVQQRIEMLQLCASVGLPLGGQLVSLAKRSILNHGVYGRLEADERLIQELHAKGASPLERSKGAYGHHPLVSVVNNGGLSKVKFFIDPALEGAAPSSDAWNGWAVTLAAGRWQSYKVALAATRVRRTFDWETPESLMKRLALDRVDADIVAVDEEGQTLELVSQGTLEKSLAHVELCLKTAEEVFDAHERASRQRLAIEMYSPKAQRDAALYVWAGTRAAIAKEGGWKEIWMKHVVPRILLQVGVVPKLSYPESLADTSKYPIGIRGREIPPEKFPEPDETWLHVQYAHWLQVGGPRMSRPYRPMLEWDDWIDGEMFELAVGNSRKEWLGTEERETNET